MGWHHSGSSSSAGCWLRRGGMTIIVSAAGCTQPYQPPGDEECEFSFPRSRTLVTSRLFLSMRNICATSAMTCGSPHRQRPPRSCRRRGLLMPSLMILFLRICARSWARSIRSKAMLPSQSDSGKASRAWSRAVPRSDRCGCCAAKHVTLLPQTPAAPPHRPAFFAIAVLDEAQWLSRLAPHEMRDSATPLQSLANTRLWPEAAFSRRSPASGPLITTPDPPWPARAANAPPPRTRDRKLHTWRNIGTARARAAAAGAPPATCRGRAAAHCSSGRA